MGLEREIVACVGSSSTAARGTYDWIAELGKRPRNERFRFLNFGVGGIRRTTLSDGSTP